MVAEEPLPSLPWLCGPLDLVALPFLHACCGGRGIPSIWLAESPFIACYVITWQAEGNSKSVCGGTEYRPTLRQLLRAQSSTPRYPILRQCFPPLLIPMRGFHACEINCDARYAYTPEQPARLHSPERSYRGNRSVVFTNGVAQMLTCLKAVRLTESLRISCIHVGHPLMPDRNPVRWGIICCAPLWLRIWSTTASATSSLSGISTSDSSSCLTLSAMRGVRTK